MWRWSRGHGRQSGRFVQSPSKDGIREGKRSWKIRERAGGEPPILQPYLVMFTSKHTKGKGKRLWNLIQYETVVMAKSPQEAEVEAESRIIEASGDNPQVRGFLTSAKVGVARDVAVGRTDTGRVVFRKQERGKEMKTWELKSGRRK